TPQKMMGKDRLYENPGYAYYHQQSNQTHPHAAEFYYIYDSYGRYPSPDTAPTITDYRLQALQSDSEYGLAETNCFILRPGYFFSTTAHPSKKLNDNWQVISAHHQGRLPQSAEEDNQGEGGYLTNRIQFISSRKQWRPPYQYKPQADGPEVATV